MSKESVKYNKLKEQFLREANERLHELETGLLNMEQGLDPNEQITLMFRGFHGLKGIAGYVDAQEIIELTNTGEALLIQVRDDGVRFRPEWIDLLLGAHDELSGLLEAFRVGEPAGEKWREQRLKLNATVEENSATMRSTQVSQEDTELFVRSAQGHIGGLEVYLNKWKSGVPDKRLLAALTRKLGLFSKAATEGGRPDILEVLSEARKTLEANKAQEWTQERIDDFRKIPEDLRRTLTTEPVTKVTPTDPNAPRKEVPPHERRLDIKAEYVEKMEVLVADFSVYAERVFRDLSRMRPLVKPRAHLWLSGMASDLKKFGRAFDQSCRRLHLVPLSRAFSRLPRMVRDIAKSRGKLVEVVTIGAETELEKDQVEKLGEPVTHLIRNAVDHGLETPEERVASGKQEKGLLAVSASSSKGMVTIEIRDDGRGIDIEALRRKAVEKNKITAEEAAGMPSEELINLMFWGGISTRESADTISGRGVGMNIVKTAMEELGGDIKIESTPNEGTAFRLLIPLDLD
ncbi:chemotaxis protein CheA [Thermodesulfobacteriota bacterium]